MGVHFGKMLYLVGIVSCGLLILQLSEARKDHICDFSVAICFYPDIVMNVDNT